MLAVGILPNIGPFELIVILCVVLLLFGSRLPSVMRSMGQGIVEFKKGLKHNPDDDGKDAATPPR